MTRAYTLAELAPLERTYLGVLATGIVPARLAGDPWLRMDYITAVCHAIVEGKPKDAYLLGEGPEITPAFRQTLNEAALALDAKGIISAAPPPPPDIVLGPDLAELARPAVPRTLDFDQHPRIWDRYLGHEAMEALFRNPAVYPFLMGKYQDSSEIWGRLYQQGYGRWR
jgi:hypothetical protein